MTSHTFVTIIFSIILVGAGVAIGFVVGGLYAMNRRLRYHPFKAIAWTILCAVIIALAVSGLLWARG